jgi:hypothetical protein
MWLTPNEAELHSRHEELIERARQATQPYVERHRADVAGSWVDIPRGERHIAFARDVERHRAALEALAPDPGVLVVRAHERTEAELEALMERVIDDGDELRQLGLDVFAVAYDEETNVVEVEVEAMDAETAQRVLSERYGKAVRAEWIPPDTH